MEKITSIEELKEIAKGEIIELPGWTEEKPFVCRVKKVSILNLASEGKIPNTLLSEAEKVYSKGGGKKGSNNQDITELLKLMELVAAEVLLEPTLEDIKESGLRLTDDQLNLIFDYSQKGVGALKKFREKPVNTKSN